MATNNAKDLTPKQLHFARCIASGMSQIEAYSEAYNVKDTTKKSTTYPNASRLMANSNIKARVEYLIRQKEQALIRSQVDTRTKVLKKLEEFMDSAQPSDSVKLKATELLGKSIGLFKDVVESNTTDNMKPEDIEAELKAKLEVLLSEQNTDKTIN